MRQVSETRWQLFGRGGRVAWVKRPTRKPLCRWSPQLPSPPEQTPRTSDGGFQSSVAELSALLNCRFARAAKLRHRLFQSGSFDSTAGSIQGPRRSEDRHRMPNKRCADLCSTRYLSPTDGYRRSRTLTHCVARNGQSAMCPKRRPLSDRT